VCACSKLWWIENSCFVGVGSGLVSSAAGGNTPTNNLPPALRSPLEPGPRQEDHFSLSMHL
jgi:hypothetical protein